MKTTWSLDELYKGVDDPAFLKDWDAVQTEIAAINNFANKELSSRENAAKKIETYLKKYLDILAYHKLSSFLSLTLSVDSTNEEAMKRLDQFQGHMANLSAAQTVFTAYVGASENLDEIIQSSSFLQDHSFVLKETFQKSSHTASPAEEELLAKLSTTGSDAWENQYNALTSTVPIAIDLPGKPKEMTLTALRNLAYDGDQYIRRTAYHAELEGYKKMDTALAASLNAIKGEAHTVTGLHNYDSVLQMTLNESRLDEEILTAMWDAILESLPAFRRYFRRKAELLGHTNGLPFYDLFAPIGKANATMSYEEAADFVMETFTDFHPEMGAFAKHAFENRWIDVYPKEGKRGGAFCSSIHSIGESRIMTNFSDSFEGALTLGHELGHGYHGHLLKNETALNAQYPMPIAETASTFCEILLIQSGLKTATKEESISILESYLLGLGQTLVDIYSRFLFEDRMIQKRKEGPLSVNELKELMLTAQKDAYGDGLDPDFLHPYMWACKPHYYRVDQNYYNYPYAYGQLFALGLYAIYEKEGDAFLPKYDALLTSTGQMNLADVGAQAGIDVRDKAFWKTSLAKVLVDVDRFLELTK